ncbi:unnamed protein product [Leptosia nina]|uniref:Craniofacial development protein 1 n=1 Tax=Leptosia nina TaxID=320188 RepID=A0AAV1J926_9NEOP
MSSGSESDDDYVPAEPEKVSEEESADEETEKQYENEVENRKRKGLPPRKGKKKLKTKNATPLEEAVEVNKECAKDPEDEKKREEDLWEKFLEGTDSKPKQKTEETTVIPNKKDERDSDKDKTKLNKPVTESDKDRERRIFEFAGETIVVENNVIKEKVKTSEKPASALEGGPVQPVRSTGGLSNIVGQLNKKNTLSTLEKSKLDWNTYKKEEGIEEEITSHNKGRDGYLDRQDFLGRADLRQYEIERDLRTTRRSNR